MNRVWFFAIVLLLSAACAGGPPAPAAFNPAGDACATCRMRVVNQVLAAQIVAPGEDPLFFDDIGCLVEYISRHTRMPAGSMAYVVDHQTGAWIPAATARYTRNLSLATPMNSHLIAHESLATQQADPAARDGVRLTAKELIALDMPDGTR